MKYEIIHIHEGQTEGVERILLTTDELCERCRIKTDFILDLVNEGVINPASISGKDLTFELRVIDKVKKAKRLQRDLELNMAGVALALELLDRIDDLERRLRRKGFNSM